MLEEEEVLDSSPSLPPVDFDLDVVSVEVMVDLGRWVNLSMASALCCRRTSNSTKRLG